MEHQRSGGLGLGRAGILALPETPRLARHSASICWNAPSALALRDKCHLFVKGSSPKKDEMFAVTDC
jgi:hypothetical protein